MKSVYRQVDLKKETENFEAFDLLTTALTDIDNYQSSERKDKEKELLSSAAESISKALEADKDYFKARYFQAVVNYLQGENSQAIYNFTLLLKSESASHVDAEIKYNLAVVNSEARNFGPAIEGFENVIAAEVDPETKLLARACLLQTCAKRIDAPEHEGATEKEIEDRVKDPGRIETQIHEIWKTLTSSQGRMIDDDVVEEVKRILDGAPNQNLTLPRRRRRRILRRLKRSLFITVIIIIVLLLVIPYLYLYIGFNKIPGW